MTIKQKNTEDEGEEKRRRWGGTFKEKNWDEEEEQ